MKRRETSTFAAAALAAATALATPAAAQVPTPIAAQKPVVADAARTSVSPEVAAEKVRAALEAIKRETAACRAAVNADADARKNGAPSQNGPEVFAGCCVKRLDNSSPVDGTGNSLGCIEYGCCRGAGLAFLKPATDLVLVKTASQRPQDGKCVSKALLDQIEQDRNSGLARCTQEEKRRTAEARAR